MAKKNKRRLPRLSEAQRYQPQAGATPAAAPTVTPSPRPVQPRRMPPVFQAAHVPTEEELKEEYRYVTTDLRRIGILALAMLAVLIVLAVVLI